MHWVRILAGVGSFFHLSPFALKLDQALGIYHEKLRSLATFLLCSQHHIRGQLSPPRSLSLIYCHFSLVFLEHFQYASLYPTSFSSVCSAGSNHSDFGKTLISHSCLELLELLMSSMMQFRRASLVVEAAGTMWSQLHSDCFSSQTYLISPPPEKILQDAFCMRFHPPNLGQCLFSAFQFSPWIR